MHIVNVMTSYFELMPFEGKNPKPGPHPVRAVIPEALNFYPYRCKPKANSSPLTLTLTAYRSGAYVFSG